MANSKRIRAVRLFSVPYHSGEREVGMGRGPTALVEGLDLPRVLERRGCEVTLERIDLANGSEPEIARVVELDRRLARGVREGIERGEFPLVLAGNCTSCLGTCAGIPNHELGVVWFDAHADFDTPEDNLSGFFDVMGLSILTGACWKAMRESIPGFRPVEERNVVLVSVRDLLPYQRSRLETSALHVVSGEEIRRRGLKESLLPALDDLRRRTSDLYLHVDLDSLDPSEGRANPYAAPGGLRLTELEEGIGVVFARFDVRAAAVTAYDPCCDPDGRMARAALRVVETIAEAQRYP
jgi:arginase